MSSTRGGSAMTNARRIGFGYFDRRQVSKNLDGSIMSSDMQEVLHPAREVVEPIRVPQRTTEGMRYPLGPIFIYDCLHYMGLMTFYKERGARLTFDHLLNICRLTSDSQGHLSCISKKKIDALHYIGQYVLETKLYKVGLSIQGEYKRKLEAKIKETSALESQLAVC
ncbi:hypothetical protein IEQ34_001473 [Dendrobium chrysotoxum]|uniref:Uncharacterized protein n=1 Tax=Dendrobium chrysotoxum TaxID=161865 RepID=A0AAV7HP64_DENCH|nr:hypothetical protein IEQ34_001473 [Dendrobium chrysotoxum]